MRTYEAPIKSREVDTKERQFITTDLRHPSPPLRDGVADDRVATAAYSPYTEEYRALAIDTQQERDKVRQTGRVPHIGSRMLLSTSHRRNATSPGYGRRAE